MCLRAIPFLFRQIQVLKDDAITLRLSAMEIYNEVLIDLLRPLTSHPIKLTIMENSTGIIIPNLFVVPISSEIEAMDILLTAFELRKTAEHNLNRTSSRSHVIYTYYMTRTKLAQKSPQVIESKIHFVDLAGSEKTAKTRSEDVVLTQANHINRSLSFLEQVVLALTQTNRKHIPYRQSKLTHALKDCLGGNCLTHMIACVWGCEEHLWESLSTLKFASRMTAVVNNPSPHDSSGNGVISEEIKSMRHNLRMLKAEILARDNICGTEPWYPELTASQKLKTYSMIGNVLLGPDEVDVQFHSLSQVHLMISMFRKMLMIACINNDDAYRNIVKATVGALTFTSYGDDEHISHNGPSDIATATFNEDPSVANEAERPSIPLADSTTALTSPISDPQSFEEFRASSSGRLLNEIYEKKRMLLTENKKGQKELVAKINSLKLEIDKESRLLQTPPDEDNVVDLQEKIGVLKNEYRDNLKVLKARKHEAESLDLEKSRALASLIAAFDNSMEGSPVSDELSRHERSRNDLPKSSQKGENEFIT